MTERTASTSIAANGAPLGEQDGITDAEERVDTAADQRLSVVPPPPSQDKEPTPPSPLGKRIVGKIRKLWQGTADEAADKLAFTTEQVEVLRKIEDKRQRACRAIQLAAGLGLDAEIDERYLIDGIKVDVVCEALDKYTLVTTWNGQAQERVIEKHNIWYGAGEQLGEFFYTDKPLSFTAKEIARLKEIKSLPRKLAVTIAFDSQLLSWAEKKEAQREKRPNLDKVIRSFHISTAAEMIQSGVSITDVNAVLKAAEEEPGLLQSIKDRWAGAAQNPQRFLAGDNVHKFNAEHLKRLSSMVPRERLVYSVVWDHELRNNQQISDRVLSFRKKRILAAGVNIKDVNAVLRSAWIQMRWKGTPKLDFWINVITSLRNIKDNNTRLAAVVNHDHAVETTPRAVLNVESEPQDLDLIQAAGVTIEKVDDALNAAVVDYRTTVTREVKARWRQSALPSLGFTPQEIRRLQAISSDVDLLPLVVSSDEDRQSNLDAPLNWNPPFADKASYIQAIKDAGVTVEMVRQALQNAIDNHPRVQEIKQRWTDHPELAFTNNEIKQLRAIQDPKKRLAQVVYHHEVIVAMRDGEDRPELDLSPFQDLDDQIAIIEGAGVTVEMVDAALTKAESSNTVIVGIALTAVLLIGGAFAYRYRARLRDMIKNIQVKRRVQAA